MSSKSSGEAEASSPKPKGGEESEEESEVLEESPCGRWQKRREEVRVLNCFIVFDFAAVSLITYATHAMVTLALLCVA